MLPAASYAFTTTRCRPRRARRSDQCHATLERFTDLRSFPSTHTSVRTTPTASAARARTTVRRRSRALRPGREILTRGRAVSAGGVGGGSTVVVGGSSVGGGVSSGGSGGV
jgi:hypothetical protein